MNIVYMYQVRDISHNYDTTRFDVVYHDDINNTLMYSPEIYDTHAEAVSVALALNASGLAPMHWDACPK